MTTMDSSTIVRGVYKQSKSTPTIPQHWSRHPDGCRPHSTTQKITRSSNTNQQLTTCNFPLSHKLTQYYAMLIGSPAVSVCLVVCESNYCPLVVCAWALSNCALGEALLVLSKSAEFTTTCALLWLIESLNCWTLLPQVVVNRCAVHTQSYPDNEYRGTRRAWWVFHFILYTCQLYDHGLATNITEGSKVIHILYGLAIGTNIK